MTNSRAIQFSHDFFLTKTPKLTILQNAENKIRIQPQLKKRVNPIFSTNLLEIYWLSIVRQQQKLLTITYNKGIISVRKTKRS